MATLVVVYKDTLVKIVKQVYLNVFPDCSLNINSIYDHYWNKTLFLNLFSIMKTEQFIVMITPDLKQEVINCYWISTHFFETLKLFIAWEPMNIDIRDLNRNKTFHMKKFLHLLKTLKLKINKYWIITFSDSHLQILMSVILIHVKTADLAQIV